MLISHSRDPRGHFLNSKEKQQGPGHWTGNEIGVSLGPDGPREAD